MERFLFAVTVAMSVASTIGCRALSPTSADNSRVAPKGSVEQTSAEVPRVATDLTTRKRPFAILGPMFSDPRLWHGTAPLPWQYAYNLCVAGSQFTNTVLGGDPDETLSSRLGRADRAGIPVVAYGVAPAVDLLLGADHCQESIEDSEARLQEVWSWEQGVTGGGTIQRSYEPN
jgi:hypothetical protein